MLRPGIFTMHDPHLFRIFEFNECFTSGQFPCRWSANSAKGYGVPLFNFYTQVPYWFVQIFIVAGFSILNSAKIVYLLSLVLSAFSMYALARTYWGKSGALVSAVFYVYAPYRAVDVWVRGALPEALAFVIYPLVILYLDRFLETRNTKSLLLFSLCLALLINIHNLSFLMFLPFLFIYWFFRSFQKHDFSNLKQLLPAGLLSLSLSAFYLLPVLFESKFVTLSDTVTGYYNYRVHFATLKELFVSRFWGYGASLWAQKYLSISIGQLHWILPLSLFLGWLVAKKKNSSFGLFFFFGLFALFLTHGKSSFIWSIFQPMKYIQFPWRFLSIAVFFVSLSVGYIGKVVKEFKYLPILLAGVILVNFNFFRPDIWRPITDKEQFTGELWDEGRSSSLTDFWPIYGEHAPTDFAPVNSGISKNSDKSVYQLNADTESDQIILPQVYFPGWSGKLDYREIKLDYENKLGLIKVVVPQGRHQLVLKFRNTPVRSIGNVVSLLALFIFTICFFQKKPSGSF